MEHNDDDQKNRLTDQGSALERAQLRKLRNTRWLIGLAVTAVILIVIGGVLVMPKLNMGHHSSSPQGGRFSDATLSEIAGRPITGFFTSDGAVDTEQVSKFFDNLPAHPPGFEEKASRRLNMLIDNDAKAGTITQDQATALKQAFTKELGL